MKIAVILPAAGSSERYALHGGVRSKLDEDLGGKSVLQRCVELFSKVESPDWTVGSLIVAGPNGDEAFAEFKGRHGDRLGFLGVTLCRGGKSHRFESVAAALRHVSDEHTHIAVHDAARPCAPLEMIERVFDAAARFPAVVPAVEVSDTLKKTIQTHDDGHHDPLAAILGSESAPVSKHKMVVECTIDRTGLRAAQTPQVFERDLLRRAYEIADPSATDDAALVERLGVEVVVVDGDPRNIKITRPGDLALARSILNVKGAEERPASKRF